MTTTETATVVILCTLQWLVVAWMAVKVYRDSHRKAHAPSARTGQAFDATATAEWVNAR